MDTLSKVSEYLNNLEAYLDDGDSLEARKGKVEKSEKELEMFEGLEHKSVMVESEKHRVVVFTKAPHQAYSKPFMSFSTPYSMDGQGAWDVELDMADSHNYMTEEMLDKLGFVRIDYGDYGRKMVKEVRVEIHGYIPDSSQGRLTPISLHLVYKDDEYNYNYYMMYKHQKCDLDNAMEKRNKILGT
ncbi:hypothetical protein Tco_0535190 [Tanacetum coccineum]